jgi:hypothetical protein
MGPIRNPRWEQKRTEGYVIVSNMQQDNKAGIKFNFYREKKVVAQTKI